MTDLKIIGTSHISKQSVREIHKAYEEFEPDVVAVELDRRRLQSLFERQKGEKQSIPLSMVRRVGITGYVFLVLGSWLQKKLAGIVKVEPGVDMLTAVNLAREHKKTLLLVDQDIMVTMRRMSKEFGFFQKLRMLWDVIAGPFQKRMKINLAKVPSKQARKKIMNIMQKRYPGLHRALVEERNVHMCVRLDAYARKEPEKKILLVVGAGHEEDLRDRLKRSALFDLS